MPFYPKISGTSGGGGGGGVTALTAVGSSPNANAGTISGTNLTIQPADLTNPGVVTAAAQIFGGAKTFELDANNFVTLNPSTQSMVKLQGNNNLNSVLFEAKANGNGTNENPGYILSTSAGDHIAGWSASGPNTTYGATYPPNLSRLAVSLVNGYRVYVNESTPGTKFDVWTLSSSQSASASRFSIDEEGKAIFGGNGAATRNLIVNPNDANYQIQLSRTASQVGTNFTNTNAAGYTVNFINNNLGSFGVFQQTGSTAGFSIAPNDGTQVVGNGAGGVMLWAQSGPVQFGTSGGGAAVRMQVKANGTINMILSTFVSDAAAGAGGLVTGDLYLLTATNSVTSKT